MQKEAESLLQVAKVAMQMAISDAANLQKIEDLLQKGEDNEALVAMRCYFGCKKPSMSEKVSFDEGKERRVQVQ
jgi:hypothetical protein